MIELADDDNDGAADTAVIEAALTDAAGIIDSFLKGRYALPFTFTPPLLTKISADLAVAALFGRRRESNSPLHEARAQAAIDTLESIARGEVNLDNAPLLAASDSTTRGINKIFGSEQLEDF